MAPILDQDFGSESEGGDFNPEPGIGSDEENDRGEDSEEETSKKTSERRRIVVDDDEDDDDEDGDVKMKSRPGKSEEPQSDDETPAASKRAEDASDSDAEEQDDAQRPKSSGGESKPDEDEDDEDEDKDDEEDEDDDDEDAVAQRPRKRARRDPRNQFLDVEAEVDEEDEGDEEDEEVEKDGFIADTHPDDLEDLREGVSKDDRKHRELDMARERQQHLDAEEEVQRLRERYGRRTGPASDAAIVPRRLLLPSVDDPNIWGVRCKPGKEREIIFAVMKRMEERAGSKNPMPIISAFERGGPMAGYLYVEARRQADVIAALEGVMNVYPRTNMVLVPIKEMPDLLRVTKSEQLQPAGYVRIKRGKYAGDLAQIEEVETNGLEVSLRIVPRLDYGQNEDENAPMVDGGIKGEVAKRKRAGAFGLNNAAVRPPPRLFSEVEAKKKHLRNLQQMSTFDKKSWQYFGDTYVNGYLMKDFKIQHLITHDVNPTLEEVTRFTNSTENGAEDLDLSALAQTLKNNSASEHYLPGDVVEVYEGEQSGIFGKAVAVRGEIVTIGVTEGELRGQTIEVPQKGLRKRFREGDHVKVIGGSKYRDEVGMIVSIQRDTVTLVGDLSLQEITVFSKDLREASDSGVAGGLGRYDIHDLVQLDPITVGCVIKVDRESLRVLDQNGSVRTIMPSQISNKIDRRRNAVATDRNGSEIRLDDTVKEVGGDGQTGVIIHIHRSFLFLLNREQTENSGASVVRANNVTTIAAKGGRIAQNAASTGPDLSRMNPAMMRNGGAANGMAPPPPRNMGRDRALGQTVTIRRGPHKGLLGIVKDTTDTEARVELHTKSKTVSVLKDYLGFKDPLTGQTIDYARFSTSRGRGGGGMGGTGQGPQGFGSSSFGNGAYGVPGSRTPAYGGGGGGGMGGAGGDYSSSNGVSGSRTPLALGSGSGGRTPAWSGAASSSASGGRTPAWAGASSAATAASGARTPAWQQPASYSGSLGSRTPAYAPVGNDGSRTVNPYAAGGDNDGSRTVDPYSSGSGDRGGGRTPAWNPTATASSYSHLSSFESSAPRPYDAPTPSRDFAGAPTPAASGAGASYAATPKFSGDAPTPFNGPHAGAAGGGASAAGGGGGGGGFAPETPGWSGDNDEYTPATPAATSSYGGGEGGGGYPRYEEGTPSP